MVKSLKRLMHISLLIVILLVSLFYVINRNTKAEQNVGGASASPSTETKTATAEDVVKLYVDFMSSQKFEELTKEFPNAIGMIVSDSEFKNNQKTLEEAEKEGLKSSENIDFSGMLKEQHNYIQSLFGDMAWDNVTYKMVSVPAAEVYEAWVEKATGKVLTEEEGRKLNKQFWSGIAEKEGLTAEEFFADNTAKEELKAKIDEIISKYEIDEPIEIKNLPQYDYYKVILSFLGTSTASTGETDFHIQVSNKNEKWSLHDGLQWITPDTGSEGDI